jgi:hypothetical protein
LRARDYHMLRFGKALGETGIFRRAAIPLLPT